jgi:Protein of unknown function (DUF627).
MNTKFLIFCYVMFFLISPAFCRLSIDSGPTWECTYSDCTGNTWLVKGDEFYKSGNYIDALECYNNAIRRNNKEKSYYVVKNHQGDALYKLGYYENALENYNSTLNMMPMYYEYYKYRLEYKKDIAITLLALGKYEDALQSF